MTDLEKWVATGGHGFTVEYETDASIDYGKAKNLIASSLETTGRSVPLFFSSAVTTLKVTTRLCEHAATAHACEMATPPWEATEIGAPMSYPSNVPCQVSEQILGCSQVQKPTETGAHSFVRTMLVTALTFLFPTRVTLFQHRIAKSVQNLSNYCHLQISLGCFSKALTKIQAFPHNDKLVSLQVGSVAYTVHQPITFQGHRGYAAKSGFPGMTPAYDVGPTPAAHGSVARYLD